MQQIKRRLVSYYSFPIAAAIRCAVAAVSLSLVPLQTAAVSSPSATAPTVIAFPNPLTLGDAVTIALSHLPAVDSAREQIEQALGSREEARSEYYPNIVAGYQYSSGTQQQFGGHSATPGVTIPENTSQKGGGATLQVNQIILDSGAREDKNGVARQGVFVADDLYEDTRQRTILTVTEDYYNLLEADDLITVAQAQVTLFQQTVDLTNAQIQAGTVAQSQLYQANADLANARVSLVQDQNSMRTSAAALKIALGLESDVPVTLESLKGSNGLPDLPVAPASESLDALISSGNKSRQDLAAQSHTLEEQQFNLREAEQAEGITLSTSYGATEQATNDLGSRGLTTQLLLNASVPVFDGGLSHGAVRIGRAQLREAQDEYDTVTQQVRLDIEQAYDSRDAAYQAAVLAQDAVKSAQVNVDAAIAERKEGVGTTLEVTTAVATLAQAQNQYVAAVYNTYTTEAQLDRAVGRNDTVH